MIFGLTLIGRGFVSAPVNAAMIVVGLASLAAYVRHARREPDAILDLSLLSMPTFFSSAVGGFIFRVGIGAIPFLLPLMLQLGFGLSPFASGSLTFAAAAGAMLMKFSATAILRRFGFRQVLIVIAMISGVFLASYGFFTQATPGWLILAALLLGGFFRSLEFTALNAIGYADISLGQDEPRDQLFERLAANVADGRHRRRRRGAWRRSSSSTATPTWSPAISGRPFSSWR